MKKHFPLYTLLLLTLSSLCCRKAIETPNLDHNIKGCGDFIVYKIINEDMVLSVRIDHSKIAFSKDFQTFTDIASESFATVRIEQNCDTDGIMSNACNDVFYGLSCQSTHWKLQKGGLSFKVSKVLKTYNCSEDYLATVILSDATFIKDGSTETRTFDTVEFVSVRVGWCAG